MLRDHLSVVVMLEINLGKLVTFINDIYFLVFREEILDTLILFLGSRILEIQNFPQFLEIVIES